MNAALDQNGCVNLPPEEKYVPKFEYNLIKKRMSLPVAHFTEERILEEVEKEDLRKWGESPDGPLMPDTTKEVSQGLGEACWGLIKGITP